MPALEFKGKSFVYTHHLSVPFRELVIDPRKSLPAKGQKPALDDNLIIHGDNLHALKALLPVYAGKVDCIFIDPPYNTGNEGWCYNDNVNSPLMKEWTKKAANPVDKEDLQRHDKWLCMMWPRITLLRELLANEGSIWMTLDDNEIHRARVLFDEIFGAENFVCCAVWEKTYTPKSNGRVISTDHDYVLAYCKSQDFVTYGWNYLERSEEQKGRFTNSDNDPEGPWRTYPLDVRTENNKRREKYRYAVTLPSGRVVRPAPGRHWALPEQEFKRQRDAGEIYFGKTGDAMPTKKVYLTHAQEGGILARTWWKYEDVKGNQDAKKTLLEIMGADVEFITPKPYQLIQRVLDIATDERSIVLDSFAGSGTTAHAVLAANKKDGGSRKFILVETEDYADSLTAERVRRVIKGYKFKGTQREELHRESLTWTKLKKASELIEKADSFEMFEGKRFDKIVKKVDGGELVVTGEKSITEKVEGLGGSFTYATLGPEMSIDKLLADGLPSFESLAKYVFYTATGQTLAEVPAGKKAAMGFIGETDLYRVHLLYQPDKKWLSSNNAALTEKMVDDIVATNKAKKKLLVFAAAKFMGQRDLSRKGVDFCQLPYAIHRILGD